MEQEDFFDGFFKRCVKSFKPPYSSLLKLTRDSSERSIVFRYDTRSLSEIFQNGLFPRRDDGKSEPEEEGFLKDSDSNKTPEEDSESKTDFLLVGSIVRKRTPEEESEYKKDWLRLFRSIAGKKTPEEEEKRKQVEELVREYDGLSLSAVPESCLKTIMLWTGLSSFISSSIPIAMRDGEQPNWPPVQVVRVVLMFLAMAFIGSLLGLLMGRKSPKISFYSGYVSLISLLFALGMIAFFAVMSVFERI